MGINAAILVWVYEQGYRVIGGEVVSPHIDRPKSLHLNTSGYPSFSVTVPVKIKNEFNTDRRVATIPAHRLVAYQKYGDEIFQEGIQVRHLDNNRANFNKDNIDIGTPSENHMDLPRKRRVAMARKAARRLRKFTDTEVIELRKILDFLPLPKVAEAYSSSKSTISYIKNRKTYKHI